MVVEKEIKLVNPKFTVADVYYWCECKDISVLKIVDTYMVSKRLEGVISDGNLTDDNLVRIREIDGAPYFTVKGPDMSWSVYKKREEFEVLITPLVKDVICGLGQPALVIVKDRYVLEGGMFEMIYDTVYGVSVIGKDIALSHDLNGWYNMIQTNIFEVEDITDKGLD
ncbi:MAG: hypothetical protein K0B07_00940 [DPANN group archaeon]|nr:hypothetical protein [DPANN group archaeon]